MKRVKHKLMAALFFSGLLVALFIGGYNIYSTVSDQRAAVAAYRQVLVEQFDRGLKLQVETAVSLIERVQAEQTAGRLTDEQAKKQAADLVRDLRFDDGNYFWIDTADGVNVVLLGRKETEGKSRLALVDNKGNHFIEDILRNGQKDGGGYSDYWFPKPNESEAKPKRAYSRLYKPYNWVIGTGNWNDHIDTLVAVKEREYAAQLQKDLAVMGGITVLSLVLLLAFAGWISNKLSGPIEKAAVGVRDVAGGDLTIRPLAVESEDEVGNLSRDFNEMLAALQTIVKEVMRTAESVAASSEELTASSQQSAEAAQQVAGSIATVADGSAKQAELVTRASVLTDTMQAALREAVARGKTTVEEAGARFQKIFDMVGVLSKDVQQLVGATNAVERDAGEVSGQVQAVLHVSDEIAAEAQTVSAATEEQTASMEEIAVASRSLAEMAESLQLVLSKFKL